MLTTQQWKYPPSPGPYENDGCYAVMNEQQGNLILADRTNPEVYPVQRDSNVAFAHIAMTFHDPLVSLVETLCNGLEWNINNPYDSAHYDPRADMEALAEARALLARVEEACKRRNT
jgi:hypothetical protein